MKYVTLDILQQIKRHEGLELKPYIDTVGKLSIGYGRNLDDVGISEDEASYMLMHDANKALRQAKELPYFEHLNHVRQGVIVDMIFNLGFSGFKRFRKMNAALEIGDYNEAANEMMDSRWATQVGLRAKNLSKQMRSGHRD